MPNQSPEPTPIGHRGSAVAVSVTNTAVAQLFSLGHLGHALTDSFEMKSYWLVSSGQLALV